MRRSIGLLLLTACVSAAWAAGPPVKGSHGFTQEQMAWLIRTAGQLDAHAHAGRFDEAAKFARERTDLRQRVQGRDHWQTIDERLLVDQYQRLTKVLADKREQVGRSFALNAQGMAQRGNGRYSEGLKLCREALQIREKALGESHPETATGYNNVATCLDALGKAREALPLYRKALAIRQKTLGENHPDTASSYNNAAHGYVGLGDAAEALKLCRQALQIREKTLGKTHPETVTSYNNVAFCLKAVGRPGEALPLFRQALLQRQKLLGEADADTASSYNNVASCLKDLGRAPEALPLFRKALEIRQKALGEDHPDTAASYHNVAYCLKALGRASEALALHRKSLLLRQKVLGDNHPDTALSYNSVALCLWEMGRKAEALPMFQKALSIRQKAFGERHPLTATSYGNVAACLNQLGKGAEALPLYRTSLEIHQKTLGENHPETAAAYDNLAGCLFLQGKKEEALPLFRAGLRIREKTLGEHHPVTARSYNNVAECLNDLEEHAEALPLFRKALRIRRTTLGESHPDTAIGYNTLTHCLWQLGQTNQALRLLQQSLAGHEAARFHLVRLERDSGFDRAVAHSGKFSPRAALAFGLARLKQPRNAFAHAEASLARGLLDDLASPASEDVTRLRALQDRLQNLDAVLIAFAGRAELTDEQRASHEVVRREQRAVADELAKLVAEDSARRVLPLDRIQKAIPADAALVLWIDVGEVAACVLRREGEPLWTHLPGSGKDGLPTQDDRTLPNRLHQALTDPAGNSEDRRQLSAAFLKQMLDPLRQHLKGVKRLFVVPSGPLARVPLEALTDDFAVSYVPSGSVLARLTENHRAVDGSSLLAIGDPDFDRAAPPAPPASGVLITSTSPGSNADKAGLRPGDVLLSVGDTLIDSANDVKSALDRTPAAVRFWRDGKRLEGRLPAAPLGAALDPRSARAAVRAWRKEREAGVRGTGHKRLPGTRLEVESIAPLFESSVTLLGSDASEQKLDELIAKGKLKAFKIIHVATHGEVNERLPGRSALILAQDDLPDALEKAQKGGHVYDGRLTVSKIRAAWSLDADLVVLSACETGLGKDGGGDGLLGFSQAFLSRGARSVVLSRWPVDDVATSLLMRRFYQNLLGKRSGLSQPLRRVESLREAKDWLRQLSAKEAARAIESLPSATLAAAPKPWGGRWTLSVGNGSLSRGRLVAAPKREGRPYAHPYYWAAFTLVGDPD